MRDSPPDWLNRRTEGGAKKLEDKTASEALNVCFSQLTTNALPSGAVRAPKIWLATPPPGDSVLQKPYTMSDHLSVTEIAAFFLGKYSLGRF